MADEEPGYLELTCLFRVMQFSQVTVEEADAIPGLIREENICDAKRGKGLLQSRFLPGWMDTRVHGVRE